MGKTQSSFQGCLLGGAIGDALGNPVEFLRYSQIQEWYGQGGIQDLLGGSLGVAEITDDTQMTLFTAEGILRAETRGNLKGICHPPTVVYHAYLRWLFTQDQVKISRGSTYDGWLIGIPELHNRRAPGNTCLSALRSLEMGQRDHPLNNSKGCGGVMRVAPAGLFYPVDSAFDLGADFAAITHSHPSGYLSAGTLAYLIACLMEGMPLPGAVEESIKKLEQYPNHEECVQVLKKAIHLVQEDLDDPEAIWQIGEGWVGEEALAIAVYCSLKYPNDFQQALIAAVNHDGDSDSTGAITGNILGAALGIEAIPLDWQEKVELREVILQLADDLLTGFEDSDEWWQRYPGY